MRRGDCQAFMNVTLKVMVKHLKKLKLFHSKTMLGESLWERRLRRELK